MVRPLPTLRDVAAYAGVSYATADRVLNNRGGVAEKSSRRVRDAVAKLGYIRNAAAANLSQGRIHHFAFLIPDGSNLFFARLRASLVACHARLLAERIDIHVVNVEAFDARALAKALGALRHNPPDGVAFVGIDDPLVVDAVSELRAQGLAVLTLVSDAAPAMRHGYVGVDNLVAGRMAGRLLALSHIGRAGRVLPIIGAHSARDHAERLRGMAEVLNSAAPEISIARMIEGRDRHNIVEAAVKSALDADPSITAIYSAGAGNAGLVRVLESLGSGTRPTVILHELVAHSRRALEAGLVDIVIDQRPEDEVELAINLLRQFADRRPVVAPDPIVPAIYMRDNLPANCETPNRESLVL